MLLAAAMVLSQCGQQMRSTGADDGGYSESNPVASSGDIVVSNGASDSILLLDPDGFYKALLFNADNTSESPGGVTYNTDTNEVVFVVDGADRLAAVSLTDLTYRNVVTSTLLSGVLRGITQLINGDYLIIESNVIERYTADGFPAGSPWPRSGLQTNPNGISARAAGGFVMCSYGTDVVRTYDDSGTQIATASSGIAGTTDAYACTELSNGNIAVAWSGTTDTIQIRSPDLSTVIASYSNTSILGDPEGIAEDNDGNLLITDGTFHHIVVIDSSANFVTIKANSVLNLPRWLFVVP